MRTVSAVLASQLTDAAIPEAQPGAGDDGTNQEGT
jgi:hypothetical protein